MLKNYLNIELGIKIIVNNFLVPLLFFVTMLPVHSDDTEIFNTGSEINNNVLFVMDNSGSMNELVEGTDFKGDVTVSFPIISSDDDAEEENIENWWNTYHSLPDNIKEDYRDRIKNQIYTNTRSLDLELAREENADADINQFVGLRFNNINIPKNAVLKSAYIQFTADSDLHDISSDSSNLTIEIEDRHTPKQYSHDANVYYQGFRKRSYHGTVVSWNPPAWNVPNESEEAQRTPDLKPLIQLAVEKGGWSSGKPMAFKISGTGKRSAQSFDFDDGSGAAKLYITFEKVLPLQSRLQVMQNTLKKVLANAPSNLSVGISHYGDRTGSSKDKPNGIKFPTTPVNTLARPIVESAVTIDGVTNWSLNNNPLPDDTVTVRKYLSEIADSWEAKGSTPIVDALYEAARYFRGEELYWGNGRAIYSWTANATTYTQVTPSLVKPITDTYSVETCASTPSSQWVGSWSNGPDYIQIVRNGNQSWNCPADTLNPPGINYSKENCSSTEYGCNTRNPEWYCLSWKSAETETLCDRIGPDEDGNYQNTNCRTIVNSPAYCRNASNSYKSKYAYYNVDDNALIPDGYGKRTYSYCRYKRCVDKHTQHPVPKYISPANSDCQSNNIILMSDGKPEYQGVNGTTTYPKGLSSVKEMIEDKSCENSPFGFNSGTCGKELTRFLSENDINSELDGEQLVDTYVIGFSTGITKQAEEYLKSLVTLEDDSTTTEKEGYFSAESEAELTSAFTQALTDISKETRSQASPGYSINVQSGLENDDDIYIPVFDKNSGVRWSGNLKKFKMIDANGHRYIRGKGSQRDSGTTGYANAMTELGLFKDDAWDLWSKSESADGNKVEKGGSASLLDNPRRRNLYTNVDISKPLSHSKNRLHANNNYIKNNMLFDIVELGLTAEKADEYRKEMLRFIRGWVNGIDKNEEGEPYEEKEAPSHSRKHMGDMLHSEPVVITYDQGSSGESGKKKYIFAATNEGYLHVFDSESGDEVFAFMPKELLKNIPRQFTNIGEHVYGIDGSISYFITNNNHNGQVDGNEEVWLYFGLRRGGTSYYALNVTDINRPKLEWVIKGGDKDFKHLNQSWSPPYIANSNVGGNKKPVVIFTGGNDPQRMDYGSGDEYEPSSVIIDKKTNTANGVYIVDAVSGRKLWDIFDSSVSGASSELIHGIPGGARILDVNRNGYLDRLYFGDTGGNVWRLDLKEDLSDGSVLTKLAKLGGSGSNQSRKFYNEPDVAILRGNGGAIFSVSIGSGLRPHPLNEKIKDHMFVLLDKKPFIPMQQSLSVNAIEMSDLEEISISGGGSGKTIGKSSNFEGKKITEVYDKKGYRVKFGEAGEKVLASSITFEGSIIFTTLVPKVQSKGELVNSCVAPTTQGRLYALNLLTGEASMNLNGGTGEPNDNDAFVTISANEIPGSPQQVFNSLECSSGQCKHDVDVRIGKKSTEVSTKNVESIESVYWNAPAVSH